MGAIRWWWRLPMWPRLGVLFGVAVLLLTPLAYLGRGRGGPGPAPMASQSASAGATSALPPSPPARPTAPHQGEDPLVWRTKGGHVAAVSREKLERATRLVAQGDHAAFEAMLASDPGVFVLKPDLAVYVSEAEILGSVCKIRLKGQTAEVWTVREAITQ